MVKRKLRIVTWSGQCDKVAILRIEMSSLVTTLMMKGDRRDTMGKGRPMLIVFLHLSRARPTRQISVPTNGGSRAIEIVERI